MTMSKNQEYKNQHYDYVKFWTRKGKREEYKARAAELGMSLAGFLTAAIESFDGWGNESFARHADGGAGASTKTQAESAETGAKAQLEGEIPIINSEDTQNAQNQPVSTQVQTIQPATENAPQRITGNEKRLIDAVKTLTPESQKALLKFLETMQG